MNRPLLRKFQFVMRLHAATGGQLSAEAAYKLCNLSERITRYERIARRGPLTARQTRARRRTVSEINSMLVLVGGELVEQGSGNHGLRFTSYFTLC